MKIAVLTISDRALRGEYEDLSGAMIEEWLSKVVTSPYSLTRKVIGNDFEVVNDALIELCDQDRFDLVLTTGGTGPSAHDNTPLAMRAIISKELPGFGELLRRVSLDLSPVAILSRDSAGIRGHTLIINIPAHLASIRVCLETVFPSVPHCLKVIGAGQMETNPAVLNAYRSAS